MMRRTNGDFSELTGQLSTGQFPASGVTAGTYTNAMITVDTTGRVMSASSGSGGGAPGGSSGSIQYNNGGTFGGFGSTDGTNLTVPGNVTEATAGITNGVFTGVSSDIVGQGYAGFWIGQATPTSQNYVLLANAGAAQAIFNAPGSSGTLLFRGNNVTAFAVYANNGAPYTVFTYNGLYAGDANAVVSIIPSNNTYKGLVTKAQSGQSGMLHANENASGTPISGWNADGSAMLPSLADSAAANNSLYFSTTTNKLTYKDPSGTLHAV
jgi:hypothetical protein